VLFLRGVNAGLTAGTFVKSTPEERRLSRDTHSVRVEPVDRRFDNEWGTDPTVNYRVIFWITETRSSAIPAPNDSTLKTVRRRTGRFSAAASSRG
jgi:hypothetical protein